MPFDPLQIVDRAVFSADGGAFLSGQAPASSSPPADCTADVAALSEASKRREVRSPPTFAKLLGVSPRFLARRARSAAEATLLMDVASAAAELDVLLESLADQLSDRARILEGLAAGDWRDTTRGSKDGSKVLVVDHAHTALLALQVQAKSANARNVSRLLERFQARWLTLLDLRYLLAQEVDKLRVCLAVERSVYQSAVIAPVEASSSVVGRQELLRLERALLERLNALERDQGLSAFFESLALYEGDGVGDNGDQGREVCWAALSHSSSDESKRSLDNTRLSTTFASLQSLSTPMSDT